MGYSYAPIGEVYWETNPDASDPSEGIILLTHYARPNYFDGDQVELPLTGRAGDVLGGYDLVNHTDADPAIPSWLKQGCGDRSPGALAD